MKRERRMLWGTISMSNKVNRLSTKAKLLYTWTLAHFDDEGFLEGTPKFLKATVLPLADEIPLEEIKPLIIEILLQKLWKMYHFNGSAYIFCDQWNERQTFHGIHQEPSKIKQLLIKSKTPESVFQNTKDGVTVVHGRCISKEKLSKVKKREVKNKDEPKKIVDLSFKEIPNPTQKELERRRLLKEQSAQLQNQK